MFSFISVFLVLKASMLFCSLNEPKCFLRIKDKKNKDGDKEVDCFFSIYTKHGHMKNEHFSGNLDKQLTTKNIHLILSLYFAIEEINMSPHLLPNISLLVKVECKLLADGSKVSLSSRRGDYFPNYNCGNHRRYLIVLTGPMWLPTAMLGPLLYISRTPEVRRVLSSLKNIHFVNPAGDLVNLNQKENMNINYDIFYTGNFLQSFGIKVKIGKFFKYFTHPQELLMYEELVDWATDVRQTLPSICSIPCHPGFRKSPQEGKAVCCFDCIPCPENEISNMTDMDYCFKCPDNQYANPEGTHCLSKIVTFLSYEDPMGVVLACLALGFSALTAAVFGIFLRNQDTPIVKANNRALSYCLLISLIYCFLCSLLFIGQPHILTCIMQQTIFAVVFTVAISTVLTKTITVVLAFRFTLPSKRMRWLMTSGASILIIPICTMIQLIICGIWLGTSPPFVDSDGHIEHGHILVVCNKGSVIAFYCVLGYLGSIALTSFTVAFLARNLPDTFNEAKFLTFSMLVFCSVWLTFLPVYHSTNGKALVAVEVFCILTSTAGIFLCIFAPKCYIILLKPENKSFHKFRHKNANV
uniref:Vomeronasal 2, receptor 76 n=1 Tax=Mus musculus TaxID=10090 RepID=A0A3B2W7A4_MOUSE